MIREIESDPLSTTKKSQNLIKQSYEKRFTE